MAFVVLAFSEKVMEDEGRLGKSVDRRVESTPLPYLSRWGGSRFFQGSPAIAAISERATQRTIFQPLRALVEPAALSVLAGYAWIAPGSPARTSPVTPMQLCSISLTTCYKVYSPTEP